MKIGDAVAWGARDNSYGTLQVASSVCATEVRFVYVSGYVSCNTGTGRRIGCGLQTAIFGCSGDGVVGRRARRCCCDCCHVRQCADSFSYICGCMVLADGAEFGCGGSDWIAIHLSDSNEATGNERTIAPASGGALG